MKKLIIFLIAFISNTGFAQLITSTYTSGDIPTNDGFYSASCNGPLTTLDITLPVGGPYQVTGIDVSYDMEASGSAWMSDQMSKIYCQNTTLGEASFTAGANNGNGVESYNRNGLTIANGSYSGGTTLTFEMQAYRTWSSGGASCGTNDNKVVNNTWTITVHYFSVVPMSYVASNVSQASTSDVGLSQPNQKILKLELETAGGSSPFDLTEVQMNMNGTTSLSDVTNVKVFYTSSNSFSSLNQFGATQSPAAGTLTFTGSQTLETGLNYIWIAYDIAAGATVGNFVDAELTQITMNGAGGTQAPNGNPAFGNREIVASPPILPLFMNGGFENSSGCPSTDSEIDLVDGLSSCWTTFDYYNTCGYSDRNCQAVVPSSGNGFIGSFGGTWSSSDVQTEFAIIDLDNPTVLNGTYEVNIDINLESGVNSCGSYGMVGSCMDYGIYFYNSTNPPVCGGSGFLAIAGAPSPQVTISGDLLTMGVWTSYTRSYVADDVYDKALIGFFPNASSGGAACSSSPVSSYAYVDNLCMDKPGNNCVIEIDSSCIAKFNVNKSGQICVGEEITLTNTSFSEFGIDGVNWEINDTNYSTNQQITYAFAQSGVHKIDLIANETTTGCVDDTSFYVFVNGIQVNDFSDSISICVEENVLLGANANLAYNYCNLNLILNDQVGDGWDGAKIVLDNGRYLQNVVLSDAILSDTISFDIIDGDSVTLSFVSGSNDSEISFEVQDGNGVSLYTISSPSAGVHFAQNWSCGGANLNYTWTLVDTVINVDSFNYQFDSTSFVYLEIGVDGAICSYLDTIAINSYSSALDIGLDTTLCFNQEFSIVLDVDADSIVWSDGSVSDSLKISETGVYWAQAYKNGCVALDSINVIFEDIPFVFAGIDTTILQDSIYVLQGEIGDEIVSYYWNDNQEIFTDESFLNPKVKLTEVADFYLYGETANGCFAYDTVTINVKENEVVVENCDLLIPTAFTPNNDGVNDLWNIVNIDCYSDYKLMVFNRWGTKVYEGKSGWSGDDLPSASYFYLLNYTDLNNEEVTKQGALTIIR